ncbi:amidohydrolase, partial [Nocardioides hankookensis]
MSNADPHPAAGPAGALVDEVVHGLEDELVGLRRDLHAHPELSWRELRTTSLVAARITQAGWRV